MAFGSALIIVSAFNYFIQFKTKMLLIWCFTQCCFNQMLQALSTLPSFQNLLSLLMRLIKSVQGLFNEAQVA